MRSTIRRMIGPAICTAALIIPLYITSAVAQIIPGEGMDSGLGGGNIIAGTVLSASGQRLTRRVQVRLETMTRGSRVSTTDDNGNFIFRGVPSGNYTVVIDKEPEYEPLQQVVDVIQLRGAPAGTYTLSLQLKMKASADAKPAVINADFVGVPKAALEHFAKAQEMSKAKDFQGAIGELELAILQHPKFMLAHNEMGVQYLRLNNSAKADEFFLAALDIDPEAFSPLMNRGILLVTQKKYAEAEPVLSHALKIKSDSPVAHYFLGQSLANQGKFPEAEKELVQALSTGGPEMNEARRLLAILYSARGNKSDAAKELETYLKLAPNAPDAQRLRETIKQLKGSSQE